ncbi:MAG TPA: hypothetical protein VN365_06555 [Candidatus Thermoplasmatota archaeon]|nr:hypothetical protein [Candidatus Thermoplasmatota archaeon]
MKKILWFVILFVFLVQLLTTPAQAGLQIWPGKLTISMPEGYPTERISYLIEVTNPYTYSMNASARVENPDIQQLSTNYSYIPDLSWITVEPETLYLPANTSSTFKVFLDVPKSERSSYYNTSWESWVVISSDKPAGDTGGLIFQVELAVKLFIHTPSRQNEPTAGIFIILIGVIITSGVIYILLKNVRKNIPGK